MDAVGQVASSFNAGILKEPRGFIKLIEFIIAICAFATTTSFSSTTEFTVKCNVTKASPLNFSYSYPFNLYGVGVVNPCNNTSKAVVDLKESEASSAQFYVFVGVIVFLYCIGSLVLYLFFDELYRRNDRVVIIDFVASAVLAALWLISSSAWAQGVSNLKYYTDPASSGYFGLLGCSSTRICEVTSFGNFAGLNISIIFGFLNLIVWVGNLWFLWKETPWFKARAGAPSTTAGTATTTPPPQQPPSNQY